MLDGYGEEPPSSACDTEGQGEEEQRNTLEKEKNSASKRTDRDAQQRSGLLRKCLYACL